MSLARPAYAVRRPRPTGVRRESAIRGVVPLHYIGVVGAGPRRHAWWCFDILGPGARAVHPLS